MILESINQPGRLSLATLKEILCLKTELVILELHYFRRGFQWRDLTGQKDPNSGVDQLLEDFGRDVVDPYVSQPNPGLRADESPGLHVSISSFYTSLQGVLSELRLGFVDFDFECFTVCPTLLGLMGNLV